MLRPHKVAAGAALSNRREIVIGRGVGVDDKKGLMGMCGEVEGFVERSGFTALGCAM